jgi:hypothetical protein
MDVCLLCLYYVLSCAGRGLCDGLITRPEESYRVSVCVFDQETPKREAKGPSWTISACEWMNITSYLTLRKGHRLKMFDNRVVRRIFWPKNDGVISRRWKLHDNYSRKLYISLDILLPSSINTATLCGFWLSQTGHSKLSYPLLIPSNFGTSRSSHTSSNHLILGLPSDRLPIDLHSLDIRLTNLRRMRWVWYVACIGWWEMRA